MDVVINGRLGYRSDLMKEQEAFRFARCLTANERFTEVFVFHDPRAKGERAWYLQWQPATDEAGLEILARLIAKQNLRAQKEGEQYVWDAADTGPFWRVATVSKQVYEVGADGRSCTCPHYEIRLKAHGVPCKHLIAFNAKMGRRADGSPLDPSRLALEWPDEEDAS